MTGSSTASNPSPEVGREFATNLTELQQQTHRVFFYLLPAQWVFTLFCAAVISPRAWEGTQNSVHIHVWAAIIVGGVLTLFPMWLIMRSPLSLTTRLTVAAGQVMFSALLIHLMEGRIEAHFHVFGSLAILAFYRDWRVYVPAVGLVAADHLLRGMFWPQSVFGVLVAGPWRAFEHAGYVVFEATFLIWGVTQSRSQLWNLARMHVSLKKERDSLEERVADRTAEALDKQAYLDAVIAALPNPLYWKDRDLIYEGCNQAFAEFVGLADPSEVIGKTDADLPWGRGMSIRIEVREQFAISMRQAFVNKEEDYELASGVKRSVMTSMSPIRTSTNEVHGVLTSFIDVTDNKSMENRLSQAQKLESLGQLAAGIAHEINTPMQCVSGNVEFLRNCCDRLFQVLDTYQESLESPQRSWQERIDQIKKLREESRFDHIRRQTPMAIAEAAEAAERVIEIVRAMKAMSHPGTEQPVPTDLIELIRNTVTVSRNRWKPVAKVELELDEAMGLVEVMPAEINQVLLNMLVNAADAIVAKDGESPAKLGLIVVRARREAEGVRIEVSDTGSGMTKEVAAKVFDPFFTTKDVGKGTGQGLAITYDVVVRRHGGSISVDSTPGVGTTFILHLPQRVPGTEAATEPATASATQTVGADMIGA
jgi:PAS domain S-box-containing protein